MYKYAARHLTPIRWVNVVNYGSPTRIKLAPPALKMCASLATIPPRRALFITC